MSMPLGTGGSAMSRLPMTHSSEAAPAAHVTCSGLGLGVGVGVRVGLG